MSGYLKKPLTSRDLLSAVCKFADPALGGTTSPPEEEQKMHDATSSDVFDRDGALARLGGKRQLLQKLLDKFEEDAPAKIGQLAAAVADNDQPEVVRLAHALKNSAALIHAGRMSNMARDMESAADHGNMSQVKTLLEQLKSISRETLDTIRNSGDM
jgi:HPt (histidine-containing phosphotransfer) domain-containing protein